MVTVGKHSLEPVHSLPYHNALRCKFHVDDCDEIAVSRKLCAAIVSYSLGHFVVLDVDVETGLPTFGNIVSFVSRVKDDENYDHGDMDGGMKDDEWYCVVESENGQFYFSSPFI